MNSNSLIHNINSLATDEKLLWDRITKEFKGVFERKYFANNGPLVRKLDKLLADILGVKHALCVVNDSAALMVLCKALELSGEVIVPALSDPRNIQALMWSGITPVVCDVDKSNYSLNEQHIRELITENTIGVLGGHQWENSNYYHVLKSFCECNRLIFIVDVTHTVTYRKEYLGTNNTNGYFSLFSRNDLHSCHGGVIITNDDSLAEKVKTIRNFHPSETYAPVSVRMNAKMSEAQAVIAIINLEKKEEKNNRNKLLYELYSKELSNIPGLTFVNNSNCESITIKVDEEEFDLTRDELASFIESKGILEAKKPFRSAHLNNMVKTVPLPISDNLCKSILELPVGENISAKDVLDLCNIIKDASLNYTAFVEA